MQFKCLFFSFLYLSSQLIANNDSLENVSLQLKWTHSFQFAGYYAAKEKGYYKEAGLKVEFIEADSSTNVVKKVLAQKVQYGVGTSSLLLSRAKGLPVVALAVIFQHSPYQIFASSEIHSLKDLIGKTVMIESDADELFAYLKKENVPLDKINLIPHSFNGKDLIAGKIKAMSGYLTNDPYFLNAGNFTYQRFSPRSVGIDFYGDNLFTSELEIKNHPKRTSAFLKASMRGWDYALTHQSEIINLIMRKYSPSFSKENIVFQAKQMTALVKPDLVEIGYMNPVRWKNIANTYISLDLLKKDYKISKNFLYENKPINIPTWLLYAFFSGLVMLILITVFTIKLIAFNRKLKKTQVLLNKSNFELSELAKEKNLLLEKLKEQANRDPLTNMYNKRHFAIISDSILELTNRSKESLSVIMIDIDKFKNINDTHGHIIGDKILILLANKLMSLVRKSDTIARVEGEEFAILLPNTSATQANILARKIREEVEKTIFEESTTKINFTISLGVYEFNKKEDKNINSVLHKADKALYAAKNSGRNRVSIFQ
ncbi:MAG: diguanylate cyclase [Campylobacteraceae bacterium]|nr:diguanylate cyclase [Campylobacteraceae bacterium]